MTTHRPARLRVTPEAREMYAHRPRRRLRWFEVARWLPRWDRRD